MPLTPKPRKEAYRKWHEARLRLTLFVDIVDIDKLKGIEDWCSQEVRAELREVAYAAISAYLGSSPEGVAETVLEALLDRSNDRDG